MTPLESILRMAIASDGPMPIDRFMAMCLGHPQHGYYMTRDPFGQPGDFTTSPEINQVFGELIGIWIYQAWQNLGAPKKIALIELGPGRGTLMADALRATRKLSDFHGALDVHFVETSPILRASQERLVPSANWHSGFDTLPQCPSIFIANEFFDAIPIRQFVHRDGKVFERAIDVIEEKLSLVGIVTPRTTPVEGPSVFEISPARTSLAKDMAHHLHKHSGCGLIIDYGHRKSSMGDTLQAMRAHTFCDILETPGEVDLTAHVDFEALAHACESAGVRVCGLMTQREFLLAMGVGLRSDALSATLDVPAKSAFLSGVSRLVDDDKMGQLFKVLGVHDTKIPMPFPFATS